MNDEVWHGIEVSFCWLSFLPGSECHSVKALWITLNSPFPAAPSHPQAGGLAEEGGFQLCHQLPGAAGWAHPLHVLPLLRISRSLWTSVGSYKSKLFASWLFFCTTYAIIESIELKGTFQMPSGPIPLQWTGMPTPWSDAQSASGLILNVSRDGAPPPPWTTCSSTSLPLYKKLFFLKSSVNLPSFSWNHFFFSCPVCFFLTACPI